MPPLYGRKTPWKAHPRWQSRYDFAVPRPPSRPSEPVTTDTITYVTELPLLGMFPIHAPYHITHVHWTDDDGVRHTFSRSELVTAFEILVRNWERLYYLALRLGALHSLTPLLDRIIEPKGSANDQPNNPVPLGFRRHRLLEMKADLLSLQGPYYHVAEEYSEFLGFLAESESAHIVPTKWRRYLRVIDRPTLLAEPVVRAETERGKVSDYFLRMTLLLVRGEWPLDTDPDPALQALLEEAEELGRSLADRVSLDWDAISPDSYVRR